MKNVFIENDDVVDFSRIKDYLHDLFDYQGSPEIFFNEIIFDASFDQEPVWNAIVKYDNIYAETSLIPFQGIAGELLFNNMLYHAMKTQLKGKKVYFFSSQEHIWWEGIRGEWFKAVFEENNEMFTMENGRMKKVDIEHLLTIMK